MNDTASSDQPREPSAADSMQGGAAGESRRQGGGSPGSEDQPTVISDRPPFAASSQREMDVSVTSGKVGPGSRLGHFELIECVGSGGMGQVFRARDTRLARTVALKVLAREQAADPASLLRFHNEARSAARLNHEGIAQVYFVGEDKGLPFIAFEFVEGVSIRDLVERQGVLSLADAISYTLQMAEALQHAAARHVVHRDIKPSNVLITSQRRAKLIDMGLARLEKPGDSGSDLTASGVTLGTFDYISPEQARDPRNADVRSDIYSLGCTFFYMLTGRPPFPEGTVLQKLLRHQADEPPDVRAFRPELPEEVSRVLRKMMAKDPPRRYRDSSKLIAALLSLAEQIGLRPVGPGQAVLVAPKRRAGSFLKRQLPWIVPIAALVGIVLLLDVLWSSSAPQGNRSSPDLVGTPEEAVSEPPSPEQLPPPSRNETEEQGLPAQLPEQPSDLTGQRQSIVPDASANKISSSPQETPAASRANGGPAPSEQVAHEFSVDLHEPNPLEALVAGYVGRSGLRPGVFDGRVSVVGSSSLGISIGAYVEPRQGELGGDTGTAGKPESIARMAEIPPTQDGALIVDPSSDSGSQFTTLSAACGAVTNGDVIELRYNGRLEEKPLTLANIELTIVAGEGFQPVVVFKPCRLDPIKYPRSMFTTTGSRLNLADVALELDVPRDVPADNWSLFEIGRGAQISLKKCSLTIRNASGNVPSEQTAYHPDVAFFRLTTTPGSDVLMGDLPSVGNVNSPPAHTAGDLHLPPMASRAAADRRASIGLADCIVRGEAVVLRTSELQPVELTWENGLLTTTEWLLLADSGEKTPQPSETIHIELQHLTAAVGGGLCRLNHSEFAPHQLATQVQCTNSILVAARDAGCVVEQVGVGQVDEAMGEFAWSGVGNFYEGFTQFWRIHHLDPELLPVRMPFDTWQSYWGPERENRPWLDGVQWRQLPDSTRPVHTHTPADYVLSDASTDNPAIGAAEDGRNAGFQALYLPQLPEGPSAQKTVNEEPAD